MEKGEMCLHRDYGRECVREIDEANFGTREEEDSAMTGKQLILESFPVETYGPKLREHAFPFTSPLFLLSHTCSFSEKGKEQPSRVFILRLPFYLIENHRMKQKNMNQSLREGEMQKEHFFRQGKQTEGKGRRSSGKGWNCRAK